MSEEKKKRLGAGIHPTKLKAWGCKITENKKVYAWMNFDNGAFWKGWLEGGATEYTMETLCKLGFKGRSAADLNTDAALVKGTEVELVVEDKTWEGKVYDEVKFVNLPYSRKELDPSEVKTLQGIDLRAYVGDFSKKNPETPAHTQQAQENNFTADDIPF